MGWRDYFNANMHLSGQQHVENRRRLHRHLFIQRKTRTRCTKYVSEAQYMITQ